MSTAPTGRLLASRATCEGTGAMQYPFNWLALEVARKGLRESCVVHVEDKVFAEVSSVDAWVEPRAGRLPSPDDDWLTRMGYEPAQIEPFHRGPSLADHNDCIMKQMALHARERKHAEDAQAPPPPTPRLYFACAQHPKELIARWSMRSMEPQGWPRGFYESASPAGPRAVSLRELPAWPSTLLLRMMSSGETLQRAVEELEALPADARERRIVVPILVQLQGDLPRMRLRVTWSSAEEYEAMMSYEEAVQIFEEREARRAAADRARAEADRVRESTVRAMRRPFERRLGRPLTDAEREVIAARVDTVGPERLMDVAFDLDPAALAAWLADPDAR